MGATGSATLNFGASPGTNTASVTITGQPGIIAGSAVEAWIMGTDSTADHNAYTHALLPRWVSVTPIVITPGTGFTVQGFNEISLTGQVAIRWVWS
jgi:hypothetical protein